MIRVLIERHLADGIEHEAELALMEARHEAMRIPGYISGETLRDLNDAQHYLVISTWRAARDWEVWMASEQRHHIMARVAPMLREPERVTVFEPL